MPRSNSNLISSLHSVYSDKPSLVYLNKQLLSSAASQLKTDASQSGSSEAASCRISPETNTFFSMKLFPEFFCPRHVVIPNNPM
jgi:hypothetical protein